MNIYTGIFLGMTKTANIVNNLPPAEDLPENLLGLASAVTSGAGLGGWSYDAGRQGQLGKSLDRAIVGSDDKIMNLGEKAKGIFSDQLKKRNPIQLYATGAPGVAANEAMEAKLLAENLTDDMAKLTRSKNIARNIGLAGMAGLTGVGLYKLLSD